MAPSDNGQTRKSSNVRLIARMCPSFKPEESGCVACTSDNTLEVVSQEGSCLEFTYDKVHGLPNGANNTQADIFSDVQDIVLSTLQGLVGCIIAYGPAGSGKTYTLAGDLDNGTDPGLLGRSIKHVAQGISKITDGSQFKVHLTTEEIDCESTKIPDDLLSTNPNITSLAVQQGKGLGTIIEGAMKVTVASETRLMDLTQQGLASCIVACTSMIAASSRSHVLINLTVERHLPDGSVTRGMLFFVDLAGSEQPNKDLAMALALQVLQDIVGAKTRTALLICCSPAASDAEETLSSLRFGIHAEDVMTGVQGLGPFVRPPWRLAGMDEEQLTAAHKQLLKLHEQSLHALETAEKRNEATAKLLAEVKGEREQINKVHEEIASMLRNADAAVPPRAKAQSPGLVRALRESFRRAPGATAWKIFTITLKIAAETWVQWWIMSTLIKEVFKKK